MALFNNLRRRKTETITSDQIGAEIDAMIRYASDRRKPEERRWYNNNFFDDGFHFRYVNRNTNSVVDLTQIKNSGAPKRSIPKASRQIRGVANLLLSPNYVPVVYPESLTIGQFSEFSDPRQAFKQAQEIAAQIAQKEGTWIINEWKKQELREKLIQMVILASKHSISFIQIYPDSIKESIESGVFDAFDIHVIGDVTDIYDATAIVKAHPRPIKEIRADDLFADADLDRLAPDNRLASSEVKEAYKRSKVGGLNGDANPTIIQKEAFIKEYLTEEKIVELNGNGKYAKVIAGKKVGDMCMRHVFTAGGVTLLDEYVALNEYPFVDFRFEPGDLYQTPFIERFISANKSLDIILHRIEQWANTMAAGSWSKRKGEDFDITNLAGGVVYEYDLAPPVQNQIAPLPNTLFNLINVLESIIDEQGAATSALNRLPSGVKSGVAIENLKATEYDNLTIPAAMLQQTVRRISERMLDYAADYFIKPQTVTILDNGNPTYFDIIGERGAKLNKEIGTPVSPETIVVRRGQKVSVEVESGLGFTMQGRKEAASTIIDYIIKLAEMGLVPMEAVATVTEQFFRTYQFGSTQEIMEQINSFVAQQTGADGQLTPQDKKDIEKMKVAVLEALKEAGEIGDEGRQQMIDATKVGLLEVMKEFQGKGMEMEMGNETENENGGMNNS